MSELSNFAEEQADERTGYREKDGRLHRVFSEGQERIGMKGEFELGRMLGLMPDLEHRPGGDGGVDFVVPFRCSIDVKTFRKPFNLIHDAGRPCADILVLAKYDEDQDKVELLGWTTKTKLLQSTPRKFPPFDVDNYWIPAKDLFPMDSLMSRIMSFWKR